MEVKIIGLGNPKKYEGTRHNIGRDFVTNLVKEKKILVSMYAVVIL